MLRLSDDRAHQILGTRRSMVSGACTRYPPALPGSLTAIRHGSHLRRWSWPRNSMCPSWRRELGKMRGASRMRSAPGCGVGIDVSGRDAGVIEAVGRVLRHAILAREREFYRFHLLHGGPEDATEGRRRAPPSYLRALLGRRTSPGR